MRKKINNLKILFIIVVFSCITVVSCDSENALDCFQSAGSRVTLSLTMSEFNSVLVNRDIVLEIVQSSQYGVTIETGENLLNEVSAKVIDGRLILSDDNTCNYVRDYGITKIRVETPNLIEIRSSTQYDISSIGTLNFEDLTLVSEDADQTSTFTVGDFRLTLNSENVEIVSNNLAFFYLNGFVENLDIDFFNGDGRLEGEDLIAQNVIVFHRSSNDIIVNPQQSLKGELRHTGNLISKNVPPVVEVEELYTGQLIFN